MRIKIVIFVITLLLCGCGVNNHNSIDTPEIRKFAKEFTYPDHALEQNLQGKVYLKFKSGTDGEIKIIKLQCADSILENSVKERVKRIDGTELGLKQNEVYRVKLNMILRK